MGVFPNSETLKKVLGDFFQILAEHQEIKPRLLASNLVIKFIYSDHDLAITIDCSKYTITITFNDDQKKPEVEMSMKADIAHKFWFGKINLVAALARRQMIAKGPVPKILKLLPAIKPSYVIYAKYLEERFKEYNYLPT